MALAQYRIPLFYGIHQGVTENALEGGNSPDACNMDTGGGDLSVAKGYVHHFSASLTGHGALKQLFVWNRPAERIFVAAAGAKLLAMTEGGETFQTIYTYTGDGASAATFDFQVLKIESTEYLIIANGASQLLKWDGTSGAAALFGTAEQLSDRPVNFVELYYGRLFAAGDQEHPSRLYWSCAPGDARTLEDWSSVPESENVSGGHVEVGTDSDPITGLFALSNQLLIFKRDSLFRLLGDRPGNYRILPVNAAMRQPVHTSVVRYGDVLYFLTDGGMYYFDGQEVRRLPDADKVRRFLGSVDMTTCLSAACRDVLYFAVQESDGSGGNDAVLTYDLTRGAYMVRRGFLTKGLCCVGGVLYLLDGNGYVCRFNEGDDYAGERINAYWNTPMTDLNEKTANKHIRELYLRGEGGILAVEAVSADGTAYYERVMPGQNGNILEVPLTGGGRAFSLRFSNVNGSHFTLEGGVELLIDMQRRIL